MTDNSRIEKTYAKIREKYPHITNKEEIDRLAIKLEKRNILLRSLCFFLGAVAMAVLAAVGYKKSYEDTYRYSVFAAILLVAESFRVLSKYSKAEKLYKPVLNVKYEGCLTAEKILEDGKKVFKKSGQAFAIYKLPLHDTEDVGDDGDSNVFAGHKHYLRFINPENQSMLECKVDVDTYMNAAVGSEYYVAVTPGNEAAAAYQATNWSLDPALVPYVRTFQADMQAPCEAQTIDVQPFKVQKALPVAALVTTAVSFATPVGISLIAAVAGLGLSFAGLLRQRSKLSVAAFAVAVIWAVIFVLSLIAYKTGYIDLAF